MKKKGFTLIELLAVIVILAVIALIAVPIILNVIDKARQGSAEASALGYVDAVEKQIMINRVKNDPSLIIGPGEYTKIDLAARGLRIKGEVRAAKVTIDAKGKVSSARFCIDDYSVDYNKKSGDKKLTARVNKDAHYCDDIDVVTAEQIGYENSYFTSCTNVSCALDELYGETQQ